MTVHEMAATRRHAGAAAVVLLCLTTGLPGDAKSDFESIFGEKARRVAASGGTKDDVAFAAELLEAGRAVEDSPEFQVLVYQKACELALKSPAGCDTADKALDMLAKLAPARKAEWQSKRLKVLELRYRTSKAVAAKTSAARRYLWMLVYVAEAKAAAGQASQARALYRKALPVAAYIRSPYMARLQAKVRQLAALVEVERKLKELQAALAANPRDTKTRRQIIFLYVAELDRPDKAKALLHKDTDETLRTYVPLAAGNVDDVPEPACIELAEWYYETVMENCSAAGKVGVLRRARSYYDRYVRLHRSKDVSFAKAKLRLSQIDKELENLGAKAVASGPAGRPPKDAAKFKGHYYKVYRGQVSWTTAEGKCKALGGHLVYIHSDEEMKFIEKLAGKSRLWVGATSTGKRGRWRWLNGSEVSGRLWSKGEGKGARGDDWASVRLGRLMDSPAEYGKVGGYLCEWDR